MTPNLEVLARELGVSKPTLDRWQSGESSPHPNMFPAVLKAFEVVYARLEQATKAHQEEMALLYAGQFANPAKQAVEIASLRKQLEEARGALEKATRRGFDIAEQHAEVSTSDGWHICSPFIEWGLARKKLEEALASPEGEP